MPLRLFVPVLIATSLSAASLPLEAQTAGPTRSTTDTGCTPESNHFIQYDSPNAS